MQVSDLYIYPLKSARGIRLAASDIDAFGLPGDRRAMVVDPSGHFITQREMPVLARIDVQPAGDAFRLSMDGKPEVIATPQDTRIDVDVWKTIVSAAIADDAANGALSEWVERPVKLAFFDKHSRRVASEEWAEGETPVTFTDGFQILVTTTGSLKALNDDLVAHGDGTIGMERFRPNIVIDCDEPWQEDRWAAIEIDGVRLDLVKPCARCIMTTQDQLSGSRAVPNPMPAMGRLRMSADRRVPGPLFGWNAVPRGEGRIAIGANVKIVEDRPEGWAFKRR